jgi:hypothetical protein
MLMNRNWGLCLAASALLAGTCLAQDAVPPKFYKLDFTVKEVEAGRVLNSRTYSAVVSTEHVEGPLHCSIRTGSKVPFSTGKEYTFLDLGVGIDCRSVKEVAGQLSLYVLADISSALQEPTPSSGLPPTVRQNKWSSTVLVPFKKPTVVFSSDDMASKRQMQLELTATPIM